MGVELVSVTPHAEKTILHCARVSSNQENTDPGLLRYLIDHQHWSPFEMAHIVMEIKTSRGIAQQILRHRSFSFQEFSQRYASPERAVCYEARKQATHNRQSSTDDLSLEDREWWDASQTFAHGVAFKLYEEAIERGVARECARFLLPIATETKLYMSGTIRSWIHYLQQRCDVHTQLEHRLLADQAKTIFVAELPVISAALGWRFT